MENLTGNDRDRLIISNISIFYVVHDYYSLKLSQPLSLLYLLYDI